MQLFGEEKVMGVDETSERLLGLVWSQSERAKVVRDVLVLVLSASHEGRVEEGRVSEFEGNSRLIWGCLASSACGTVGPLEGRR